MEENGAGVTGLGRIAIASGIAILLSVVSICARADDTVRFVALGDLPYTNSQAKDLEAEIKPKIQIGGFPFVIHYGDFKSGGDDCNDAELQAAYNQIISLLPGRVFFTPGDNDWTDCDRKKLDQPISELVRLAKLRDAFYSKPLAVANKMQVQRQTGYPENATWQYRGVQFATLHVVGTNNGRVEVKQDDFWTAITAVWARDTANAAWLKHSFQQAKDVSIGALVLAMQADPTKIRWKEPCTVDNPDRCDGFLAIKKILVRRSTELDKPVLLIHGDTRDYCVDRAFGGSKAPNLWRLNGAGDYTFDATVVEVRADKEEQPFRFRRLLNDSLLNSEC